jgi:hypothetical protein
MSRIALAFLLWLLLSPAIAGTIYIDTAGNGAAATNSGTTNTTTPTATGTAATVVGTTVTLDTNTNLTGVVTTPGVTQSAINIAGATNPGRTIFWITTPVTGCTGTGACTITVDTAPTGVTTNSWAVGGRYLMPSGTTADVFDGALGLSGGQDIVSFNTTPASRTTTAYITARNAGTSTTGLITIQGTAGTRPILQITGTTGSIINLGALAGYKISNLQFVSASTTDTIQNAVGALWIDNLYVSSCGGTAATLATVGVRVTNSEITGCAGDGLTFASAATGTVCGNYIHGNTGSGINVTATSPNNLLICDNLIVSNSGRGIYESGAISAVSNCLVLLGNTIANNTLPGLEVANANASVMLRNNIIYENSATHPTVLWDAGTAEALGNHSYNVFFNASAGGNLSGLTANGTEFTTNPGFVNSGTGNYAITSSSPAAGTGYPSVSGGSFPGTGNASTVGYLDIGAFQRQVTAGGGIGILGTPF